jgi:hypothetical protein
MSTDLREIAEVWSIESCWFQTDAAEDNRQETSRTSHSRIDRFNGF